jgi:predicted small secreted protein
MTRDSTGSGIAQRFTRGKTLLILALALAALSLSACTVVKDVSKVAHDIHGNKSTIDAFTTKVKSGEAIPFVATYVTTGSSPATIVYAVKPPNGLSFRDTPSRPTSLNSNAVNAFEVVVNPSGEFACTPPSGPTSTWTCQKLDPATAATENKLFDFYTPSHWITFLRDFSLAAGFAGDKITTSSMSLNGFNMSCVDFQAKGVPGTSTICTTSQGILGYVKAADNSTSFEIRSYSSSPPSSDFELPRRAKIETPKKGVTP